MRIVKAFGKSKLKQDRIGLAFIEDQLTFSLVSNNNEVLFSEKFSRESNVISSLLLLKEQIKHNYPCYLALPHNVAMVKEFNFSETKNETELNKLIKINALNFFSHATTDLYYDFEKLPTNNSRVRVVASKKENIAKWIKIFREVQLNLVRVSIDSFALEKFLIINQYLLSTKNYAVLWVSGKYLLQVIISSLTVVFMRSNTGFENNLQLLEELTKFLCLYENAKNSKNIDEIIVFYDRLLDDQALWPSEWKVVHYKKLRVLSNRNLPLSNLLTIGVTL